MSGLQTEEEIAQNELARLQRAVNRPSGIKVSPARPLLQKEMTNDKTRSPKVLDPETLKKLEELEKSREAQRQAEEKTDAFFHKKTGDDTGIELFLKEMKDEPKRKVNFDLPPSITPRAATDATQTNINTEEEEEKEALRLLKTMSGRKLFGKGGQDYQKKTLQQLEEDRQAWRKREEARLQTEKEQLLRKQEEELHQKNEQERLVAEQRKRQQETEELKQQQTQNEYTQSHNEPSSTTVPETNSACQSHELDVPERQVRLDPSADVDKIVGDIPSEPLPSEPAEPSGQTQSPEAKPEVQTNPAPQTTEEARELMLKLNKLRELLPYYTDKPKVTNVGQFLVQFAKSVAFIRGAVYLYPNGCSNIGNEFQFKDFSDGVSGFVKFLLENLNFLTFEEDRNTILKATEGMLKVGIMFIHCIPPTTTLTAEILKMQLKWEALLGICTETVVKAANQKAIVEEKREKIRRVLTSTIFKVQVVLHKMIEILTDRPFDLVVFKKFLTKLVGIYSEVHPFLPEQTRNQLIEFTRLVLKVCKAFDEGKVYPKDRCAFEKHVVLTVNHLLVFRDSI